jgi:hypothetical protein
MTRLNWSAARHRSRIRDQGAKSIKGAATRAPDAEAGRPPKASPLEAPIILDRWWKNRAHDAVYVRLAPFKEHTLIDIRVWETAADGITRPAKGFSCAAKHLPRLIAALNKASAKAKELGLLADDSEAAS